MTLFFSRHILGERLAAMQRQDREMTTTPVNWSVEHAQMCPGLRWELCLRGALKMNNMTSVELTDLYVVKWITIKKESQTFP